MNIARNSICSLCVRESVWMRDCGKRIDSLVVSFASFEIGAAKATNEYKKYHNLSECIVCTRIESRIWQMSHPTLPDCDCDECDDWNWTNHFFCTKRNVDLCKWENFLFSFSISQNVLSTPFVVARNWHISDILKCRVNQWVDILCCYSGAYIDCMMWDVLSPHKTISSPFFQFSSIFFPFQFTALRLSKPRSRGR